MEFGGLTIDYILDTNNNCSNNQDYEKIFKNKELIKYLDFCLKDISLTRCNVVDGSIYFIYKLNQNDFEKLKENPLLKEFLEKDIQNRCRLQFENGCIIDYCLILKGIEGFPLDNLLYDIINV